LGLLHRHRHDQRRQLGQQLAGVRAKSFVLSFRFAWRR